MSQKKLYSLYECELQPNGKKKWSSISDVAFPLERARVVFQDALLSNPRAELRPTGSQKTHIRAWDDRCLG